MVTLEQVINKIRSAYGSLDAPNWRFVEREYRKNPYSTVVERLRNASFNVEETTDINYDVSCVFSLNNREGDWSLHLSLVGRYAVLLSIDREKGVKFAGDGDQGELNQIIADSETSLLTQEIVSKRIPFGEFGNEKLIYSLLFTDLDELPWELS